MARLSLALVAAAMLISCAAATPTWPDSWQGDINMTMTTQDGTGGDTSQTMMGHIYTEGDKGRTDMKMNFGGMDVASSQFCEKGKDNVNSVIYGGQTHCSATCLNGAMCPGEEGECDCQIGEMDEQMNMMLPMATKGGMCMNSYGDHGTSYAINVPGGGPTIEACMKDDGTPVYFHVEQPDGGGSMFMSFTSVVLGDVPDSEFVPPASCTCTPGRLLRGAETDQLKALVAKGFSMMF
eukprot:CAMPEP_0203815740 /NCGR_PEP_ID=MMETSP0115-20131106/11373_1 /ASSEMBLY_ACC=CAM_ASM_000227 /TAXON_ID=33651 /ORGANISM="Bicosoecid sp, Strain ms1" /LENGTH=236 /DNA_ID=CAMNT_0050724639 /DNA_START=33 /DNA_END=743 /DNA_ORIENTATION=+